MVRRVLAVLSQTEVLFAGLLLAAFLALYWALRGAPIGHAVADDRDADEEAPSPGYRDRVAAAAVAGLLLVVVGAYVAMAYHVLASLPAFAAGFAVLIATIRANRKHRHASPSIRRVVQFADASLNASLLAGILI